MSVIIMSVITLLRMTETHCYVFLIQVARLRGGAHFRDVPVPQRLMLHCCIHLAEHDVAVFPDQM